MNIKLDLTPMLLSFPPTVLWLIWVLSMTCQMACSQREFPLYLQTASLFILDISGPFYFTSYVCKNHCWNACLPLIPPFRKQNAIFYSIQVMQANHIVVSFTVRPYGFPFKRITHSLKRKKKKKKKISKVTCTKLQLSTLANKGKQNFAHI